jgi:FkbH-like protein
VNPSQTALVRAEWQRALFGRPDRARLLDCVPSWALQHIPIRVHANHGFAAVASALAPYAAWNGIAYDCVVEGYDDTLLFDVQGGDFVEVVWLDTHRVSASEGVATWLAGRLRALRAKTANPIVVIAWSLATEARESIVGASIPGIRIADLALLEESVGADWTDARAESISGTRLGNQACLRIARELACCWLPAVASPPRKAIAIDLDNTLYRGVLGEDGPSGVELTDEHRRLQERLVRFREEGVLLSLVSRNLYSDVEALFAARGDFPLRISDFSVVEVSWDDKADALRRIGERLHIASDAIVFVDDNPGELAAAAAALPVFTVHAGDEAHETIVALDHVAGLFRWGCSEEDALRHGDVRAFATRTELMQSAVSSEDYLQSLDVQLDIVVGPREHLRRVAELASKTNQFNLSLQRMNEVEIARMLDERPANVIAIRLADRLSDSGIVAMLVGTRIADRLHVHELCISCRALGRRLEDAMLAQGLIAMAGDTMPDKAVFAVREGPRNEPARRWLAQRANTSIEPCGKALEVPFAAILSMPISPAIRTRVVQ